MSSVAEHYKQLLAEQYVWMFGVSFAQKVAEQKALLEATLSSLEPPAQIGPALDLGSGPGFQTIALAELGYSPITAVDSSRELLLELAGHRGSRDIATIEADLTTLASSGLQEKATLIVCMGDTLTHLPSKNAVQEFFRAVFQQLAPDGIFVITYRDLTSELLGNQRFLLVHADDKKILTCFLEYVSEDFVVVHDLLHFWEGSAWQLKKSSYTKCRLSPAWVTQALRGAGFRIEREETAVRMVLVVARRDL